MRWPLYLLLALLSACGGAPPPDVDAWMVRRESEQPADKLDGAALLGLDNVQVASHLAGIVVQRTDGEVDTLIYQRWAAPVSEMVRAWVRSRLAELSTVRGVGGGADRCDVRLRLEVRRFEFVESGSGPTDAVVELWGVLDGTPFGPLGGRAPLAVSSGPELAAAMGAALTDAVSNLVPLVDAACSGKDG